MEAPASRPTQPPAVAPGASFAQRRYACAAGSREFRLYVPATAAQGIKGLVVMLHGCTQSPEDFALGTGMNTLAERHRLVVAYPGQGAQHNPKSCWNWFRPEDQGRGAGEPAIIAGLTAALAAEFGVPASRVFVAGLSAGGAMAAIIGEAYPELYDAVGVHSGLACGAASDVISAFAAMRRAPASGSATSGAPRTIVFHGDADQTVHPSNARQVVARAAGAGAADKRRRIEASGRSAVRTVVHRPDGSIQAELWLVEGVGHAWSSTATSAARAGFSRTTRACSSFGRCVTLRTVGR
jgi:poly(hydroxyalkanoate) depolymerase family esterase